MLLPNGADGCVVFLLHRTNLQANVFFGQQGQKRGRYFTAAGMVQSQLWEILQPPEPAPSFRMLSGMTTLFIHLFLSPQRFKFLMCIPPAHASIYIKHINDCCDTSGCTASFPAGRTAVRMLPECWVNRRVKTSEDRVCCSGSVADVHGCRLQHNAFLVRPL